jgi:hypothetical protein
MVEVGLSVPRDNNTATTAIIHIRWILEPAITLIAFDDVRRQSDLDLLRHLGCDSRVLSGPICPFEEVVG